MIDLNKIALERVEQLKSSKQEIDKLIADNVKDDKLAERLGITVEAYIEDQYTGMLDFLTKVSDENGRSKDSLSKGGETKDV